MLFLMRVWYKGCDNLSLSDHLLRAVLNLLRREVSEHGHHLQQYFVMKIIRTRIVFPPQWLALCFCVPPSFPYRSGQEDTASKIADLQAQNCSAIFATFELEP